MENLGRGVGGARREVVERVRGERGRERERERERARERLSMHKV